MPYNGNLFCFGHVFCCLYLCVHFNYGVDYLYLYQLQILIISTCTDMCMQVNLVFSLIMGASKILRLGGINCNKYKIFSYMHIWHMLTWFISS